MMENTMKMTKTGIPYAKCLEYEIIANLVKKKETVEVINRPIRINVKI